MKKVVVTGASGFIGRHTLRLLIDSGFEVHALSRNNQFNRLYNDCIWHNYDLFDYESTYELIKAVRPSHIMHFAWDVNPNNYINSINNYNWVEASMRLIQNFHEFGGERVIIAGTCAEYDWSDGYLCENETPLSYENSYSACKNSLQHLVRSFAKSVDMSLAWGRIFWLYGPYENKNRLVPSLINCLMNNKEFICKSGNSTRDFLHVYDVAEAFISLLLSNVEGVVNIASGNPIKVEDLVLKVANKLDKVQLINFANEEDSFAVAKTDRLKLEVQWNSKIDIEKGISNTIDWWRCVHENNN